MITAGDEFGRTQRGNNNAYCQDNEISWVNWTEQSEDDEALTSFVRKLLELRRKHPVFRRSKFLTGKPVGDSGLKDVMWLAPEGHEMQTADWTSPSGKCLGALVFAAKQPTTTSREDDLFLMLMSAAAESIAFVLPPPKLHGRWRLVFDTARPDETERERTYQGGKGYPLLPSSFVLLHDL